MKRNCAKCKAHWHKCQGGPEDCEWCYQIGESDVCLRSGRHTSNGRDCQECLKTEHRHLQKMFGCRLVESVKKGEVRS